MAKKRDNAWMAFYPGDYLRDTLHLSTEQHGAYLLMLLHAWMNDGWLEDDDEQLANITRLGMDRWMKSRRVLVAFFAPEGDKMLKHGRIVDERAKARDITAARAEAGREGAAHRWQKDGKPKPVPKNENAKEQQASLPDGKEGSTHGAPRPSKSKGPEYSAAFEHAWFLYPKRAGGNSKVAAEKAWNARMAEGEDPAAIIPGVRRYAAFCDATGKTGTEFVKMAATFFGPQHSYLEPWTAPAAPAPTNRADARAATLNGLGTPYTPGAKHGTDRTEPVDVQARVIPDAE